MVHAKIKIYEPPGDNFSTNPGAFIKDIEFNFNPTQLSTGGSARLARTPARAAQAAARAEFIGAQPRTLSFDARFRAIDASAKFYVQEKVDELLNCCRPTQKSIDAQRPSPPWVRLEWGGSQAGRFNGCITDVNAIYTAFLLSGEPVQATCSISIEEIGGEIQRQNPTSGSFDALTQHRFIAGESLPLISWRYYGSPDHWRRIATINGIDDVAALAPGTVLTIPALTDVGGWHG
ncbi:CIS tube protein [Streptomyces sp. WZ-12]|uniref:CIS tube protein n=1 Tax=Streptomyces sp. WZ-12 TaxID=3030210 RepID=UPI00238153E3|nr:peptidase M23 [Streptomyces sp. WZ-12]